MRIELPMLATSGLTVQFFQLNSMAKFHNKRGFCCTWGRHSLKGVTEAVALGAYLQALHLE